MRLHRLWRAAFIVLLLVPLAAWAKSPDIVLKDLNGKDRNVSEYIGQGKWVVVAVWAHNCPVCNAEIYQMTFFHDEHYKKDAMVLGVSIDGYANKDKALAFIDRNAINFPNLIAEPDAAVLAKFGGGPFIQPEGGPDRHADRSDNPGGHRGHHGEVLEGRRLTGPLRTLLRLPAQ
jgi:peroxiredoxin